MRSLLLSGSIVLLLTAGTFYVAAEYSSNDQPSADILAVAPDIDIGVLTPGSEVDVAFDLRNHARSTVEIVRVVETCQCGKVSVSKSYLSSGDSCEISLKWKVGPGRGVRALIVPVVYRATDGSEKTLLLRAMADLQGNITYTPSNLRFTSGREEVQIIRVSSTSQLDNVVDVATTHRCLEVMPRDDVSTIAIRFRPELWLSQFEDFLEITLKTTDKKEPVIRIPVIVRAGS